MAAEHRLTFHVVSASLDGVVKVTRARWTEIAYRFPRTALKEVGSVDELQGSGIYFLMGVKDGCKTLYIGQAQNVSRRLAQHSVNDSKAFWTHTLVVTSTGDAVFNAAHLNYLESRFHELATEAGVWNIENSMPPSVGCGIATIQQEMDECINHTKVIFNLMGYHFLEKSHSSLAIEPQQVKEPALPVLPEPTTEANDVPMPQILDGSALTQVLAGVQDVTTSVRRAKYNFYEMGLKDGDVVVYEDKEPAHRTEAIVCAPDKIQVNGEVMTPHALAKRIRRTNNVYAFAYISWNGEKLSTIYNRVYKNFPPKKEDEDTAKLRYFTMAGADAVGRLTDDGGIVVLKGSRICAETKKSCLAAAIALRAEVRESHITQKDYTFKSLSGAANFVGGCALNGKICWTETRKEPKRKKRKS